MSKKPFSAGYFSSYDRGLECLLDMWPAIRKQVPEATLDIYYGWNVFDEFHSKNPQMMKWKWQMIRKLNDLKDLGVAEHGRVNHQELADAMKQLRVWFYPTEFTEIHCITALKAVEAGMIPVVTKVAALSETVKAWHLDCQDIYTNKKGQLAFIEMAEEALTGSLDIVDPADNRYWPDVAKVWDTCLKP